MEAYLNLDQLTLGSISEQAGKPIDRDVYLNSLTQAKQSHCLFDVWKDDVLHAYATLKDVGDGKWFVLMFVIHPDKRNRATLTRLFGKIIGHLQRVEATSLVSNVFKVNQLSVAFHQKLGFTITREAPQGFEFTLNLDSPEANRVLQWTTKSTASRTELPSC